MPFARDGEISQSPLDGGVEITDQQYRDALAGMLAGKLVTITEGSFAVIDPPEPEPEPEPAVPPVVPQSVSRFQIITGLALVGWITEQEAEDAAATGEIPAAVAAVISALPDDTAKFVARMKWRTFHTAYRDDELVNALAAAEGKSQADVDAFFTMCATIGV